MRSKLTLLFVIVWFWTTIEIILFIVACMSYHFQKCSIWDALPQDSTFVTARQFAHLGESYVVPIIHSNDRDSINYNYYIDNAFERKKLSAYTMNLRGLSEQLGLPENAWPDAYFALQNDSCNLSERFPCYGLKGALEHPWADFGWEIRFNHLTQTSWDEISIYPYQIILKGNQKEFNEAKAKEILDSAYCFFKMSPSSPFWGMLHSVPKDGFYHKDFITFSRDGSWIPESFKDKAQYEVELWNHVRSNPKIDFPIEKATILISDEGLKEQITEQEKKPILGYWSNEHEIVMLYCRFSGANLYLEFAKPWELHLWASSFIPYIMLLLLIMLVEINLVVLDSRKPIFNTLYRYVRYKKMKTVLIVFSILSILILTTSVCYDSITLKHDSVCEQTFPTCNMDSIYKTLQGSQKYFFNSARIRNGSINANISDHFAGGKDVNEPLVSSVFDSSLITTDEHMVLWVEN